MDRRFLLPTASVLTLGTTSACTPSIVGSWALDHAIYDGDRIDYPYVYEFVEDGVTFTYEYRTHLEVERDETARSETVYTYSRSDEDGTETETYTYSGTWSKVSRDTFDMVLTDGEDTLDFNCTVADDELTCVDGDTTAVFLPDEA